MATYPALERDIRCDVLIVGGGITGALMAHEFTRREIDTVLVDRRHIAYGSTSASTGLLQYEIDTPLYDLSGKVGIAAATRAYLLGIDAIERLDKLAGKKSGFFRRKSLMVAKNSKHVRKLNLEFKARKQAGLPVEWITEKELHRRFGINRPAAIHSAVAGEIDPYRFSHHLFQRSLKRGLQIFDRTSVLNYSYEKRHIIAKTERGCRISARSIIFATGYEVREMLPRSTFEISSTYALITEPLPDLDWWRDRHLVWESGSAYLYARTTEDNRVLIGGADDETASSAKRDERVENKSRLLLKQFSRLFPHAPPLEPAFVWAGAFGHTKDGLAYIGEHPSFPRGYFALGFGGNGITYSALAAPMICDRFQGRKNPDLEIFSFNR